MQSKQNKQFHLHRTIMPPKQKNRSKNQNSKSEHSIMLLTPKKSVSPHRGSGTPAVSTLSLELPSSIQSTLASLSNGSPKLVVGKPSTMSPSLVSLEETTTPPSSKKSSPTYYTPIGSKSYMSAAVKKKLKFSPEEKISAK
jgi:hypothetical protein